MAVTPFKFPLPFRKPKNIEIPKRLGIRAVVVASSNNFLLTLQDILSPDLSFIFGQIQVIKQHSRFSCFLLLRQEYSFPIFKYYCTIVFWKQIYWESISKYTMYIQM